MQPDLLRYSCQLALPGFTQATQQRLQEARVLIVGVGGLGCPAAQYLAAAGVGTIGLADFDTVSVSNLHRQVLFTPEEVGQKKGAVACGKLQKQNPGIRLVAHDVRVSSQNVLELLQGYDLVLDGTDNFDTKYLLNDACVLAGKPLFYGAIYQFDGQVAVWNVLQPDGTRSPNYRDVYPEANASQIPNCAEGGVIPTLAGMIGTMQANEVLKYLTQAGEVLAGKLLLLDAQSMRTRIIKLGAVTKTSITQLPVTQEVTALSVEALREGLKKDKYVLVDVRGAEEREAFHIGGKRVPLSRVGQEDTLFGTDRPVVFYCATGKRSAEAVKHFKSRYPAGQAFSLEGGLKAWRDKS